MRHKLPPIRAIVAGLALTAVAVACSPDKMTAPPPAQTSGSLLGFVGGLLGGVVNTVTSLLLPAVHRGTSLPTDVAVTQTVGPAGGVISIPQAGMTITFSPGAVSAPTTITATANAGGYYAYSFEPHGIKFNAPVVITQDMSNARTSGLLGGLLSVQGGYMADGISDLDQASGNVTISEQLPAVTVWLPGLNGQIVPTTSYSIHHFSGYILTGGRQ